MYPVVLYGRGIRTTTDGMLPPILLVHLATLFAAIRCIFEYFLAINNKVNQRRSCGSVQLVLL